MWHEDIWLTLESSSYCNLFCEKCSQNNSLVKNKSFLSGKLFFKIIEELVKKRIKIRSINPFFRGEPLLNPEFSVFIDHIYKRAQEFLFIDNIVIHTNAMLLGGENRRAILDISDQKVLPHPNDLFISLDSVDERIYSRIRKGGDLKTVLDNIKNFLIEREEREQFGPNIVFQMIVQEKNQGHAIEFYQKIKEIHSRLTDKILKTAFTVDNEPWRVESDTVYFRNLEGETWESNKNRSFIVKELKSLQEKGIILPLVWR